MCRGDQFIHLKVQIPKTINTRQKELLKEFEAEFEGTGDQKNPQGADKETSRDSAWQRIKDFMKK